MSDGLTLQELETINAANRWRIKVLEDALRKIKKTYAANGARLIHNEDQIIAIAKEALGE